MFSFHADTRNNIKKKGPNNKKLAKKCAAEKNKIRNLQKSKINQQRRHKNSHSKRKLCRLFFCKPRSHAIRPQRHYIHHLFLPCDNNLQYINPQKRKRKKKFEQEKKNQEECRKGREELCSAEKWLFDLAEALSPDICPAFCPTHVSQIQTTIFQVHKTLATRQEQEQKPGFKKMTNSCHGLLQTPKKGQQNRESKKDKTDKK